MKKLLAFVVTALGIALAEYFTDIGIVPYAINLVLLLTIWLWHGILWCWTALISSYFLPGWVLFVVLAFAAWKVVDIISVLKSDIFKTESIPEPEHISYNEDTFSYGIAKWRWRWAGNEILDLWAFCPYCKGILVCQNNLYGEVHFLCENCNDSVRAIIPSLDNDDALGRIKREIIRRVMTGEYKNTNKIS